MSGLKVFHTRLDGDALRRWFSVKSHVLGQMGIKENAVGTAENFISLANNLYDLQVDPASDFRTAVDTIYLALMGMSKSARRKMRQRNVSKIGYEVRPHSVAVKRAAIAAAKARRASSLEKQKAKGETRKKHLVLVAKDGKKLSANVKEHSSTEDRDAFYKTWEWRTLRMKVIKKLGRRCQCCGATPSDTTVSGDPVRLVVDHIKPLSKYWHLRLAPQNLQILCDECNMGKGAWDETDYRSESERLIAEQLRYEVA